MTRQQFPYCAEERRRARNIAVEEIMAERLRVDIAEAKNAFSELESAPDLGPASSAKAKDALRRLKSVIEKFKT